MGGIYPGLAVLYGFRWPLVVLWLVTWLLTVAALATACVVPWVRLAREERRYQMWQRSQR